jgi:DNA-binding LytR/AlgR family response regulator
METILKEFNLKDIEPGVIIFSKNYYKIDFANNAFLLQFSEFPKEELFGKDILAFHKPATIKKIKKMVDTLANTERATPLLLKKYDLNGNGKYLLIRLIKLVSSDRNTRYCLLTFDITQYLFDNSKIINYLPIQQRNEIKLLLADDILYIKAENIYSTVFTESNKFLTYFPIGYLEKKLNKNNFFRIHRSYIINIKYIDKIIKEKNCYIIQMKFDNTKLSVSRSKIKEFSTFIGLK